MYKKKLKSSENVNKIYKKILMENLIDKIKTIFYKKIIYLITNKIKLKTLLQKINKIFLIFNFHIEKKNFLKWKKITFLKNKEEKKELNKKIKYSNFNNYKIIKVNKKKMNHNNLKNFSRNNMDKIKIKKFLDKIFRIIKLKPFKILLFYKKNINQKLNKNKKYNKDKIKNNNNFEINEI